MTNRRRFYSKEVQWNHSLNQMMIRNNIKLIIKIKIAKNKKKFRKSIQILLGHNQLQLLNNKAKHLIKYNSNQTTTKRCQPQIDLNKFNTYLNNHGVVFNQNIQADQVLAISVIKNAYL